MKSLLLLFTFLIPFCGWASEPSIKSQNAVIVCENSMEMLQWDLKFISLAKYSVELSLCYTGGSVFRALMEGVEKRIQEFPNFQAYFLIAPVLLEEQERQLIKTFEEKYPNNFHLQFSDCIFEALPEYNAIDNHLKFIIVDGHYYSLGGTNFDEFLCVEGTKEPVRRPGEGIARNTLPGGMRDQDIVGRGPIAAELRTLFYKNFAMWEYFFRTNNFERDPEAFKDNHSYFPLPEDDKPFLAEFEHSSVLRQTPKIELFFSGPMCASNPISRKIESMLDGATNEISVGNLYLNPIQSILSRFKDAANRGVAISYITNGLWDKCPTYANFIAWGNRLHYFPLFFGRDYSIWEYYSAVGSTPLKTKIYEYRVPDTMYHKKVLVVDRKISLIGTYNMGTRSDAGDYEIVAVIESPEVAEDLLKVLERDKSLSEEISSGQAFDWYFDPVTAYMGAVQAKFHGFL